MLELFRKYQRYLFLVTTVLVTFSFIFFGTFSTFGADSERTDRAIGLKVNGSALMQNEVRDLSRFIAADREDLMEQRGGFPNFCNDGVVRSDFLRGGLADLLVREYFESIKGDLESRLERAKRFQSYAHPEAPFLSAEAVWEHFLPALNWEMKALQSESEAGFSVFSHLENLYQYQAHFRPEALRQILVHQHQQFPWLTVDQKLVREDLALFGFHSLSDWFGRNFIDLISEFILNTAVIAEEKGYQVSLKEAKGDLVRNFQESMRKFDPKVRPEISFQSHLRSLGFDEPRAAQIWQKVLLFRKYFSDVGGAALVDRLSFSKFLEYAHETALLKTYRAPIAVQNGEDLAQLQFYIESAFQKGKGFFPEAVLPVSQVEKNCPELVQRTVKAKIKQVSEKEIALKIPLKQVWEWQTADQNWKALKAKFNLPSLKTKDERFQALCQLDRNKRLEIDAWAKKQIVDANPSWIEEALAGAPVVEKTFELSGSDELKFEPEESYVRIEDVEISQEKHVITFAEARKFLEKKNLGVKDAYNPDKNPFAKMAKLALGSLQANPNDPKWIQGGEDPLMDQFKLSAQEQSISRTSTEDWMKSEAFLMLPELWSPIQQAENGEVVFFYLKERKTHQSPILDQLAFGKEELATDAKSFVAEKILNVFKEKNAIVIPVQKDDE